MQQGSCGHAVNLLAEVWLMHGYHLGDHPVYRGNWRGWQPKLSAQMSHTEDPLADTNECTEFPFICPREKPLCINTYGGYRCRSNKRCSRGFEPNEDGTACVGE